MKWRLWNFSKKWQKTKSRRDEPHGAKMAAKPHGYWSFNLAYTTCWLPELLDILNITFAIQTHIFSFIHVRAHA